MSKIFIELWALKPAWRDLGQEGRGAYVDSLLPAVKAMMDAGVEVLAWGFNAPEIDLRAPYDAFAVYRLPDQAMLDLLQENVRASGWYDYFDQVNVGGDAQDPPTVLGAHVALSAPLS